nr:hypothetical protein [bacterium]
NKAIEGNIQINQKELEHLKNLSGKIGELFKMTMSAFENRKLEEAESVGLLYAKLQRLGKKIHQEYFTSLRSDEKTSVSQSSIFLDAIEGLLNAAGSINSIAKVVVEEL